MIRLLPIEGFRGEVRTGEPLALHTSLKVGGPADLFCIPDDRDDLELLLGRLGHEGIPYLMIGGGYNLLVRDGGFRGVVISLARLDRVETESDGTVRAEAGVTNQRLVRFTQERGLAGIEFLAGIPGSVGGSVAVNAGAHGESLGEMLTSLVTLCDGGEQVVPRHRLDFGYRFLHLAPGEVIVEARFGLRPGDPREMEGRIEAFLSHRHTSQRVGFPSAGSFFKNPSVGEAAWRLIDRAGLRGSMVGGAQVSEVHANFLVNRGGATARDFLELAELIKERVLASSGIGLQEEVRIVGSD